MNYRKIYENHYGLIPIDEDGCKFHIHHIDGNPTNNHYLNLKALSRKEHQKIHLKQGDYGAAYLLSRTIDMSKEEISEIARLNAKNRIEKGNHPFVGDRNPAKRKSKAFFRCVLLFCHGCLFSFTIFCWALR